ncbi:MAG: ribonuclease P protein component [Caldilineales bacterium]|nr:ribonuclease P protein component [Caldilineales bacterium]
MARLRDRDRFAQVRQEGRCWTDTLLVMCLLPNELPYSRFGFSVSKRVGKAVVRNRVRRRMREVVRLRLGQIASGFDVVFIARQPAAHATYAEIERACERTLRRAQLLAHPSPSQTLAE